MNARIDRNEAIITASINEVKTRSDKVETGLDEIKTNLTASIDEVKIRLNRVETRLTASIEKVETEQKVMNAEITNLPGKMYILNR